MLLARRIAVLSLAIVSSSFTLPVRAATPGTNRNAYDVTLKCAVADGVAEGDERDLGHADKAADFEAKTQRAFNLAYTFGAKVGLTSGQVQHDLDMARDTELPRMIRDRNYYLSVVATCKAVGLM